MSRQTSLQLDDETLRMMSKLASWWGLSPVHYKTDVIRRCVERTYAEEKARRESKK